MGTFKKTDQIFAHLNTTLLNSNKLQRSSILRSRFRATNPAVTPAQLSLSLAPHGTKASPKEIVAYPISLKSIKILPLTPLHTDRRLSDRP
jgi:hypothetical protein